MTFNLHGIHDEPATPVRRISRLPHMNETDEDDLLIQSILGLPPGFDIKDDSTPSSSNPKKVRFNLHGVHDGQQKMRRLLRLENNIEYINNRYRSLMKPKEFDWADLWKHSPQDITSFLGLPPDEDTDSMASSIDLSEIKDSMDIDNHSSTDNEYEEHFEDAMQGLPELR